MNKKLKQQAKIAKVFADNGMKMLPQSKGIKKGKRVGLKDKQMVNLLNTLLKQKIRAEHRRPRVDSDNELIVESSRSRKAAEHQSEKEKKNQKPALHVKYGEQAKISSKDQ
jgi:hypothetical protein